MGKPERHSDFVHRVEVMYPSITVLGKYINSRTRVLVEGKYGIHLVTPKELIRNGVLSIKTALDKELYLINRFKEVHGDKYIYPKIKYINSNRKVKIICPKHGEFMKIIAAHMQGYGCQKCAIDGRRSYPVERKKKKRVKRIIKTKEKPIIIKSKYGDCLMKKSLYEKLGKTSIVYAVNKTEYFISKAIEVHGNKYNYSKADYTKGRVKVEIHCNKCNSIFYQTPFDHLNNHGCPNCKGIKTSERCLKTKHEFIDDAVNIHGSKFNYNNVIYRGSKIKVSIKCNKCGEFFMQTPNSHLSGQGCPVCFKHEIWSRSGYVDMANGKECVMYKIRCWNDDEEFYKIGITSRGTDSRFSGVLMPYNYEVISEVKGEAGEIWDLEKAEHRRHKHLKYKPNIRFGGETECFSKLI